LNTSNPSLSDIPKDSSSFLVWIR